MGCESITLFSENDPGAVVIERARIRDGEQDGTG